MKVSASSIRTVGLHFSTVLKTAAAVMFDALNARGVRHPNRVRQVLLPHSGVGLVKTSRGEISKQSWQ